MTKVVTGGAIRRRSEKEIYAVPVETITFPDVQPRDVPPPGAQGTAVVKRVPHDPYKKSDQLFYEDGNHHNDTNFIVTSVVGPAKYVLQVE
ncbi:MAG TPA: hypothetical protein VFA80_08835 [Xanthobacteraceae bacterium]|nr:hypothetical protein [Xanthobacteraceae bacterium]